MDKDVIVVGLNRMAANASLDLAFRPGFAVKIIAGPIPVAGCRVVVLNLVHHCQCGFLFIFIVALFDLYRTIRGGYAFRLRQNLIYENLVEGAMGAFPGCISAWSSQNPQSW